MNETGTRCHTTGSGRNLSTGNVNYGSLFFGTEPDLYYRYHQMVEFDTVFRNILCYLFTKMLFVLFDDAFTPNYNCT